MSESRKLVQVYDVTDLPEGIQKKAYDWFKRRDDGRSNHTYYHMDGDAVYVFTHPEEYDAEDIEEFKNDEYFDQFEWDLVEWMLKDGADFNQPVILLIWW